MAVADPAADGGGEEPSSQLSYHNKTQADDIRFHCVASTAAGPSKAAATQSLHYRDAQFSADGTSIVALCEGNRLTSYILPPDLLEPGEEAKHLTAYSEATLGSPVQSYALYPHYQLHDPSTTIFLAASRDQPIKLQNALYNNHLHASYPLIDPYTEAYLAPSSLVFGSSGRHFIAATSDRINAFDISRDGHAPQSTYRISSSHALGGSSYGLVKAMSINRHSDVLAVGALDRQLALFENEGLGECATAFKLPEDRHRGNGITSLNWSPEGNYLLVAERRSDCIQVYDIRHLLQHVSVLTGRKAKTSQVLGMDVMSYDEGYAVWAGGTDGVVRMWANPGHANATHTPDFELAAQDNPATAAICHPGGAVMATCSATDRASSLSYAYPDSDSSLDSSDDKVGVISLGAHDQKVPFKRRVPAASSHAATDSLKIWST